jgi:hypothetical protein
MRDGLPIDDLDEATIIASLRSAGVMSLEAAVERRVEDPDAAATEVQRIRAENAASTPSVLLTSPEPGSETPAHGTADQQGGNA